MGGAIQATNGTLTPTTDLTRCGCRRADGPGADRGGAGCWVTPEQLEFFSRDGPAQGRHQLNDDGLTAAGTWLELSVRADHEAVEAVSEILARVAPGGVSVEMPYRLVAEGLAAVEQKRRPVFEPGSPEC